MNIIAPCSPNAFSGAHIGTHSKIRLAFINMCGLINTNMNESGSDLYMYGMVCVCVKACICAFSNHFGFIIFHTRVIPSLPFIASHNHVYFRCLQHTHTHFHNHANDNVFQTFKIYPNMLHGYICSILAHTPRNLYSVDVLSFCRFWLEKLCVYHNFCRLRLWSHGVRLWGERHTHTVSEEQIRSTEAT